MRGRSAWIVSGSSVATSFEPASILRDFGWGVVDIGGIEGARYLEAMCMVWVLAAVRTNNWNQAFKLLRK